MALPQLGTSVNIVKVTSKGRKIMSVHPNKVSGKLEGYLDTLRSKFEIGECKRNNIEIIPKEIID